MRLSIQRLRWFLLAGAVLLVAVLALYIGYGRYRALSLYQRLIKHSGVSISHDTNGFTYSQSVKGKTVFTLHAKKATQIGDGKWQLHDATMTLYGRVPDKPDHIYGSEIEYDENDGVARAIGDVLMDLQAPSALAGNHPAAEADPMQDRIIHVKTSGLVYLRKLGVAATDKQVDLVYSGMHCTAQGAEFNTGQNILRLLADVKMDGLTHERPVHVVAQHAEIDRNENVANLAYPIASSQGRTGRADSALLNFETDGSVQRIQGFNNVVLNEGTRQITGAYLDAHLNDDMQLKAAQLTGGVQLVDTDPVRPLQGSASRMDAAFDAKGNPTTVTASGGARLSTVDHRATPRGLSRSMEGTQIVATFATAKIVATAGPKTRSELSQLHVTGAAHAASESLVAEAKTPDTKIPDNKTVAKTSTALPGVRTSQVAADDLRVSFVPSASGRPEPTHLAGLGHTLLQQNAPLGAQQTSTGEALDVTFADQQTATGKDALTVREAVQTGSVVIHDQAATRVPGQAGAVSDGIAQKAVYVGATENLTLTGDVHWQSDSGQIVAPTLIVNQQTQDAEAEGGVQAAMLGSNPRPGNDAAPVTHILAASARLHHATQISEFLGTDAQPAKMWQEGSQVQAATLLFDGVKRTFSARPTSTGVLVHAVLVGQPAAATPGKPARAASIVRVASPKMDYNDLRHEATFSGGVTMDGSMGQVRGDRSVVFLNTADNTSAAGPISAAKPPAASQPSPFSGSLDRVVVLGDVQMDQPGRKGTGDELLYTAATGNYILTGTPAKPPLVVDAQQGNVTGTTLLFGDAGSTIVVSGAPAAGKPGSRVRTETEVRP